MGVRFDSCTLDQALDRAMAMVEDGGAHYCVTPNPEIVYEAMHDPAFCDLLNGADLVLPDGVGVVLGAKLLGTPLEARIPGADFAAGLLPRLAAAGKRLYLLGAKPGVAEQAAANLRTRHPDLQICGTADGYFRDEAAAVAAVRAAAPDVVFVCLGAPKQERFMAAHREELGASLLAGLGGMLDVFAGNVRRAPDWVCRIGMEWFYRLLKEPRRFKRMLRLPKFLAAVVARRLRGR